MRPELQTLCENYIEARDVVKRSFKLEFDTVYPSCANVFLSFGRRADAERIDECKRIVKDNAGIFNNFRGAMFAPTCCLLACSSDPSSKMETAAKNYKLLKEHFHASDQMVLSALLLADLGSEEAVRERAERGKRIYKLMKEQHRFLTDQSDAVFAVLLACSSKSDEQIVGEIEACFTELKPMAGNDYIQTVALILATSDKPTEEKCGRFRALFEGLREAGIKYGKSFGLALLASLAVSDAPVDDMIGSVSEISDFLAGQKGYRGLLGADRKTRYMHAAMLTSTHYSPNSGTNAAALASMLSILAIQMMIMVMMICSATSAAAHS